MKLDKERLKIVLILLAVGAVYAVEIQTLGWVIRCPLNLWTGLKCPLCGITTACMALLRGDWHTAWTANLGLTFGFPLLAAYFGVMLWRWLFQLPLNGRGMKLCGNVILILACIWGVARNILHL